MLRKKTSERYATINENEFKLLLNAVFNLSQFSSNYGLKVSKSVIQVYIGTHIHWLLHYFNFNSSGGEG